MKTALLRWWRRCEDVPIPRPVRFLLVGLSGVGVNMATLWLLHGRLGLAPLPAAALAVETSICSNFALNDIWTFGAGRRMRPWWTRAFAFHATAATAAAVNLSLFMLLTSAADVHYLPANLIAIAVASGINFTVSASWTWRAAPPPVFVPASGLATAPGLSGKRVVVLPTYNESANIRRLLERVLSLGSEYEALVIDDSSPDGTGDIVAAIARDEPRVHLISRPEKLGLGSAYVAGFRRALELGADLIFQMDSDFSHDPGDLPRLAAAATGGNVVIGSRYVFGGSTPGWPLRRILVGRAASLAARILLRVPVSDATGGFKCWGRAALAALPLDSVRSTGFAFQVEMNYLAWRLGIPLIEVPITFEDRKAGQSKASLSVGIEMAAVIWRLFLRPV
ncbi:MAG: glycosyltransferase [Dehalococcoidia bacterium]|nr:glycosyltransferase [Dehalococcoidia bacterium]